MVLGEKPFPHGLMAASIRQLSRSAGSGFTATSFARKQAGEVSSRPRGGCSAARAWLQAVARSWPGQALRSCADEPSAGRSISFYGEGQESAGMDSLRRVRARSAAAASELEYSQTAASVPYRTGVRWRRRSQPSKASSARATPPEQTPRSDEAALILFSIAAL